MDGMKTCSKCGLTKKLMWFHRDRRSKKDGRVYKCRACSKKYKAAWYKENLERAREYDRLRGNRKHKRDPVKVKAGQILCNAVRCGKITRGPCAVCGCTENIDGHHEDYSKPLEVIWLCRKHHREHHALNYDF